MSQKKGILSEKNENFFFGKMIDLMMASLKFVLKKRKMKSFSLVVTLEGIELNCGIEIDHSNHS